MPTNPSPVTPVSPFDDEWLAHASKGLDQAGRNLLELAVQWVREPLADALTNSGEPLAQHSAAVVGILAELGTDAVTRASALLTVLRDDTSAARNDAIRKAFGAEVLSLVQGTRALLRLGNLAGRSRDSAAQGSDQKEMQRKMLLAMAADLRIVLLRLASRLQSLRWHASSKTPYPQSLARETMELYTPLANRLGIWQLKWEMEDLAFRFQDPETYKRIAGQLEEKRVEREAFIEAMVKGLKNALAHASIPAEVTGRPKHIFSIWNKMQIKHLEFNQLYDLRALRVIVLRGAEGSDPKQEVFLKVCCRRL